MKRISTLALTVILLFGGMIYGQANKKDSTIHFFTPEIIDSHSSNSPLQGNDAEIVPPPQVPIPDSLQVREYVEQMPQFPSGQDAMMQFLSTNIKYPEQAREGNIQGKVFASFVVETTGELSHIEIMRGIGHGCDQEVTRVLKLMPKWKPGMMNGKAVQVRFRLPVNFKLADDTIKTKNIKKSK